MRAYLVCFFVYFPPADRLVPASFLVLARTTALNTCPWTNACYEHECGCDTEDNQLEERTDSQIHQVPGVFFDHLRSSIY